MGEGGGRNHHFSDVCANVNGPDMKHLQRKRRRREVSAVRVVQTSN